MKRLIIVFCILLATLFTVCVCAATAPAQENETNLQNTENSIHIEEINKDEFPLIEPTDAEETNPFEEEQNPTINTETENNESNSNSNSDINDEEMKEETKNDNLPDIIDFLDVKLYNTYETGFNTKDGKLYLIDIAKLLKKHAPDGMWLSAASAMAYTEGGAGKMGVYRSTNNCFGIRAYSSWKGYVYSRSTGLVYKDYQTAMKYGATDCFRAYDSMEDSVIDYIKLISGSYYGKALETSSPKEYLSYILSRGYGESGLLSMWLGVMDIYDLDRLDRDLIKI